MALVVSGVAGRRASGRLFVAYSVITVLALMQMALPANAQDGQDRRRKQERHVPTRPRGGSAQLAQATITFDIPAQPLADALATFGRQSGLQVLFQPELTAGVSSPGVQGTHTPEQALQLMLADTGLTYRFTDPRTVTLERAVAQAADGPQRLAPITITARRVPTPISNIPGAVSILAGEELEEQLRITRDPRQVLTRTIPGFNETINNPGPTLRGRTALVLINGVPVNEFQRASGGFDITAIEPEAIDRIEVARGASAAYGYGAPGGIINIITRRSTSKALQLRSRAGFSFNPHHTGDSYEVNAYQSGAGAVGRLDYHLGAFAQYDGLKFTPDGDAVAFSDEAIVYNFDGSFGFDLGKGGELRLTGH